MNRMAMPGTMVGNEFVLPQPKVEMKVEASIPAITIAPQEVLPSDNLGDIDDTPNPQAQHHGNHLLDFLHRHTFIAVSIAILIIGAAAIKLGANYWSAQTIPLSSTTATIKTGGKPVSGFNLTVPAAELQAKLQTITGQPVTLAVGPYSERVDSNIVKSWLQITANKDKSEYYIHVNDTAIGNTLAKEASDYARTPVNQVTVTEDGVSRVVVGGQNGRALSDLNSLKAQARASAKNVLASKGLQFNTPLKTQPFHAVTPVNFDKLIVASTTTKKMWLFQNGKQVKSYLTSDGKASTPTPIGQFKIYSKLASQDMRGLNTDGTQYFQPHVYWVNYFSGGNAIHGVYWHPRSWFGAINSSHGCIGIPDDQAQWVYNWAPIGTTVIVHL
jgi:hypothetical protein